jgi:membrane-associated phospholipid phosphatase
MNGALLRRAGHLARRGRDFARRHRWSLPLSLTSSALLLCLADEMREGDLVGIDAMVFQAVHAWRGSLDGMMLAFTLAGGGVGMTVVCLAMIIVLWIGQRRRAALFMAIAGIGTFLLSTGLKLLFHRARPLEGYLIAAPSSFSFPSGHAMASMGVLASTVVVLHAIGAPRRLRHIATVGSGVFLCGVALSRIYFGVHYFSDVVGGQLAAAAWVSALTGWFYPRLFPGEETLERAPSP